MNPREKAGHLLNSIAESLEMPEPLKLDGTDTCVFTIDEKYVFIVQFDEESEHLLVNLPLGNLPEGEDGKNLAVEMLCGNYCWSLTSGGTLGLDEETGIASVCYGFDLSDGKGKGFEEVLSDLIDVGEYWMGKLSQSGGESVGATPGGANMMRI
jgi:hypothetical protein